MRLHISIRCRDIHNRGPRRITERANSPNKYFHIYFPPLVSHVIHSYGCESINTNTTLTMMCFCFISQRIYCIINDSRCPLLNSPHFICLKHTAVLSNQKANQLSKGCYLTKYLSNSPCALSYL